MNATREKLAHAKTVKRGREKEKKRGRGKKERERGRGKELEQEQEQEKETRERDNQRVFFEKNRMRYHCSGVGVNADARRIRHVIFKQPVPGSGMTKKMCKHRIMKQNKMCNS
jgi:hypothetical protein